MQDLELIKPYTVTQPNGSVRTVGAGFPKNIHQCVNVGTSMIYAGDPVKANYALTAAAVTRVGRWNYNGREDIPTKQIGVAAIAAAGDKGLIGVALEDIPAGAIGEVAGAGSIVPVACDGNTIFGIQGDYLIPVGAVAIGGVNHGAVTHSSSRPATPGQILGVIVQRAGTAAEGTGSNNYVGVLISPQ